MTVHEDFAVFAAEHARPLLRAAYLLTGSAAAAEDLVQTTLMNAYLGWRRVRAADSPDAYLRQILVNTHRRTARRRRVAELLTRDVPERAAAPAGDADLRHDLVAAVAALPPRQRAVVVLRYLEDRSEADVAAILGCSAGTVKSQAARALATLRRHHTLAGGDTLLTKETAR